MDINLTKIISIITNKKSTNVKISVECKAGRPKATATMLSH